jgi:hypothetical protein
MVCVACQDMSLLRRIGPYGAAFDPNGNTAGDGSVWMWGKTINMYGFTYIFFMVIGPLVFWFLGS